MLEYKDLQDVLFQCDALDYYTIYMRLAFDSPFATILGHRSSFDTTNICTHWDEANPDACTIWWEPSAKRSISESHPATGQQCTIFQKHSFFDSATRSFDIWWFHFFWNKSTSNTTIWKDPPKKHIEPTWPQLDGGFKVVVEPTHLSKIQKMFEKNTTYGRSTSTPKIFRGFNSSHHQKWEILIFSWVFFLCTLRVNVLLSIFHPPGICPFSLQRRSSCAKDLPKVSPNWGYSETNWSWVIDSVVGVRSLTLRSPRSPRSF